MPTQPIEIDRDEWGVILHHPDHAALELKWYSATERMTDEDFKASLERYADAADRLKPMPRLLIDSREFLHSFGDPGVLPWREEHIIPRYTAAGVQKLAFVMPEGTPGTIETGAAPSIESGAAFPTAWFSTRERAEQWLAENA